MALPPEPRGRFVVLGPPAIPSFEPDAPRAVRVYLPAYKRARGVAAAPPATLVLFDGQNVFEDDGSFAGGWHAHLAVDRLVASRTADAPAIVGVPHGGER